MCGIAGFYQRGTRDQTSLKRMADVMAHRGPDADGFHIENGVHLAHRRLSIVDLSAGHQPMHSQGNLEVVIFNGEIYNHKDLRAEIGEELFQTNSDTEVLLYGYRKWGVDLFNRLNGMFAFALYNKSKQELIFARDRLGQKPLYYAQRPEGFAFASELKPLFEVPFVNKRIKAEALPKYFAYEYLPVPETLFKGVWKCPPGHWMKLQLDRLQLQIKPYLKNREIL